MTIEDSKAAIAAAIRKLMVDHAGEEMLDPEALRAAAKDLTKAFKAAGVGDGQGLEDLPDDAAEALAAIQSATPADLAQVLHRLADLADGRDRPQSLEDLAAWFETNLGPVLDRRLGQRAETDSKAEIRKGARAAIDAALAKHGIVPPAANIPRQPAPGAMNRHHLFWQNFAALAPGLIPLLATRSGAEAAAGQVSALLSALDLPDQVALTPRPGGARLDFTAAAAPDTALTLQKILADAPLLDGWRFSIGGHEI